MIEFRKIKRFIGTTKKPDWKAFLQYRDINNSPENWVDILEITSLPNIFSEKWESKNDEEKYQKSVDYEYIKAFR